MQEPLEGSVQCKAYYSGVAISGLASSAWWCRGFCILDRAGCDAGTGLHWAAPRLLHRGHSSLHQT